jgi:hypothetical protein
MWMSLALHVAPKERREEIGYEANQNPEAKEDTETY